MEDGVATIVLKELREFRAENNKRWEENDKRWEQNEKRWQENDKRWEQNESRWKENSQLWRENTTALQGMNNRITALEDARKKDRREIIDVLDTMQKSINNQFSEMKQYMDNKFEKIDLQLQINVKEHEEIKKILYAHENRLNFHSSRLNYLENWKEQFDLGNYTAV